LSYQYGFTDIKHETALIWLNEDNAKTLDKQLKEEQHTSIREINAIGKEDRSNQVPRFSRIDYLKLPKIDFYQLHVEYETIVIIEEVKTRDNISAIDTREHFDTAVVIERGLSPDDMKTKDLLEAVEGEKANSSLWIFNIARESMGGVTRRDLLAYELALTRIFNEITVERRGTRYYNDLFRQDEIRSRIRLAFHKHRELKVKTEIIPQNAALLLIKDG
jgi:type III restriction enzyme